MSEQDDADVIEQGSRRTSLPAVPGLGALRGIIAAGRGRIVVAAAACALLVAAATLVTFRLTERPRANAALALLVAEVTTVPVGRSVPGLPGLSGVSGLHAASSPDDAFLSILSITPESLRAVRGTPLRSGGKPEVLYLATEYCPYCAMENWPLIVALSRFGQFTGLATSRSPRFEHVAPIDSWTFYGSRYTSHYLTFVPVEEYSNILVNAKANPDAATSYRRLQRLTLAQQATFNKYDATGATPFLDFGNHAVQVGSGFIPAQLMAGKSWPQIAAALRQPKTSLGAALLDEADSLTAELCQLTGDRPAAACPAFLQRSTQGR